MANTFGDAFLTMLTTHPFTSVAITFGAQTGYGFEFVRGGSARGFLDGQAIIEETSVLVKVGDFTGLQQGGTITVDGTAGYEISRVEDVDDAHVVRLVLRDA